jgi:hypothetical protein
VTYIAEMDEFYLFLNSGDSLTTHVNNNAGDFVIDLPRIFKLQGGWENSLSFPISKLPTKRIYVCSGLTEDSCVMNTLIPVLRSVDIFDEDNTYLMFHPAFYFDTKRDELRRLRVFIRDDQLRPCRLKNDCFFCMLHP